MKKYLYLTLCCALFWGAASGCGGGGNSSNNIADDSDSTIIPKMQIDSLPTGELHLTDADFGEIVTLTGVSHPVDEIFNISETELIVKDSLLIMQNRPIGGGQFFKIFSLPDFKHIASVGQLGNGPKEFNFPHIAKSDNDTVLCYIFEGNKSKLFYLNRQYSIEEMPFNFSAYDADGLSAKELCPLTDSTFLYVDNAKGGKAIFSMNVTHDTVCVERTQEIAFSKSHKNWAAYIGNLAVNDELGRAMYAYKYFRRLRFFDLNNGTFRDVVFDAQEKRKESDIGTLAPTNITYYWKISSQRKYIYCLYSGRTPVDVSKDNSKGNHYIYVEQFDWNGNPVRKYRLDKWGYFCVNDNEDKIYLVSTTDEHPFYSYDISVAN